MDFDLSGQAAAQFIAQGLQSEAERIERTERELREMRIREAEMRVREAEIQARVKRDEIELQKLTIETAERDRREVKEAEDRKTLKDEIQILRESSSLKMDAFDGKGNIDSYISHFERVATLNEWRVAIWPRKLAPLLQGSAREVYIRMDPDETKDYQKLKKALLDRFRKNEDYYRKQFRSVRKESSESFTEFYKRLIHIVALVLYGRCR
jgi:hypothetical protein